MTARNIGNLALASVLILAFTTSLALVGALSEYWSEIARVLLRSVIT